MCRVRELLDEVAMTRLQESLAEQDRLNEIRMMRLDAIGRFLVARYAGILWWLHVAEALSSPYLRED